MKTLIEELVEALEAIAPMSRCSFHRFSKEDGYDKGISAEFPNCGHCGLGRQIRAVLERASFEIHKE